MIVAKRLKGRAIATWLGPTGDAARRAADAVRRRVTGAPSRLDLYLELADPWSYLMAQAAQRLAAAYPVELAVHVVTAPASDVAPEPALRAAYAVRDARELAAYWNVDFPGAKEADAGAVRDVGTALVRERPAADQLRAALELLGVMWAGDRKQLTPLLGRWGTEAHGAVAPVVNASYQALRKAGYFAGGALAYGGAWYAGLDRVRYLEDVLAREHGTAAAGVIAPRPEAERGPTPLGKDPLTCELWFSFRSPYSYLALEQIEGVLAPHGVPLVLRPVLRDRPVPAIQERFRLLDAKREADRLGIPFGRVCDPLGAGVDACLALARWADGRGQLLPFARSALRGIWAEARDLTEYVDLRAVVERAGLPWAEARAALGDPEAARWAQQSAADLAVIGLWGVPSMRCGELVTWGQDRLPLLADRLRRHAAAREIVREPANGA
jgi:2-hydroxychromene-2-carboxylate isomerase